VSTEAAPGGSADATRTRVEQLARSQCTPGEIGASLWAERLLGKEEARHLVRDLAEDISAWRLAGRADVRVRAYQVARFSDKPVGATVLAAWGKQHLGWDKQGMDPGKQGQTEKREGAAAVGLKAV
jgi:hypothetical protein